MNKKKLRKISAQINALRKKPNNIRSKELQRIAKQLGRRLADRGHEPNYISDFLPRSRPISIPDHSGTMARGTGMNILDQLDQDVFDLEENFKE